MDQPTDSQKHQKQHGQHQQQDQQKLQKDQEQIASHFTANDTVKLNSDDKPETNQVSEQQQGEGQIKFYDFDKQEYAAHQNQQQDLRSDQQEDSKENQATKPKEQTQLVAQQIQLEPETKQQQSRSQKAQNETIQQPRQNPNTEQKKTQNIQTKKESREKEKPENQTLDKKIEEKGQGPLPPIKANDNENQGNQPSKLQKQRSSGEYRMQEKMAPSIPVPMILPSTIIKEAQKQRIGAIFKYFQGYVSHHSRYHQSHRAVLSNIVTECERRRKLKMVVSYVIRDYFGQIASLSKDFHAKSYKFARQDVKTTDSQNPLLNIRVEIKGGFDQLQYLRKAVGNDLLKFNDFLSEVIIANIQKAFDSHSNKIVEAQYKLDQNHKKFLQTEKQFKKRVGKVTKVYAKGKQGLPQEEDVFVEMARFVKAEKDLREAMAEWGLSLIEYRRKYIAIEENLFAELRKTFQEYIKYVKSLYVIKHLDEIEKKALKTNQQIYDEYKFAQLSVITDTDYINSVLRLAGKGEQKKQISNENFQKFFTLEYFPEYTGDASQLLKGTTSKTYELLKQDCVLINTISGNLIQFDKKKVALEEKFSVKHVSAKIVSQAVVELSEAVKTFIFSSNRTIRVTFKDADRAEQLITFLNQQTKEQKPQQ